jgi:hypothetical protein
MPEHFAHAEASRHKEHRQQVQSSHVVNIENTYDGNTGNNPTPNATKYGL